MAPVYDKFSALEHCAAHPRVEYGKIRADLQCQGLLLFEQFPHWLLSLRASDWSSLSYVASDITRQQTHPLIPPLLHRFTHCLRVVPEADLGTHRLDLRQVLTFLSGSMAYLGARFLQTAPSMAILLVDRSETRRGGRLKLPGITWRSLSHQSVGGCTTTRVLLGWYGLPAPILPSFVRRTIQHILDASIRPTPCSSTPTFAHYCSTDLLRLQDMGTPVLHPTSWSSTGWGFRSLTANELMAASDLPLPFRKCLNSSFSLGEISEYLSQLIPLKCLSTIVDYWLHSLALPVPCSIGSSPVGASVCTALVDTPSMAPTLATWLPCIGRFLPHDWADEGYISSCAVKSDDAAVPSVLWDLRILLVFPSVGPFLPLFRRCCLRRWRRNIWHHLRSYFFSTHGPSWASDLICLRNQWGAPPMRKRVQGGGGSLVHLLNDGQAGQSVLYHSMNSTWWEWSCGSTLVFWRWSSSDQLADCRDGMPMYVQGNLSSLQYRRAQARPKVDKYELVQSKLMQVRTRRYICPGQVTSLTDYFDVPKGINDVRMVYNGTSCGLNDLLWAPSFWLPNTITAARLLDFSSFCVDLDLGEMFLNFPLDPMLRPYAGVDLTPFRGRIDGVIGESSSRIWERWERQFMGLRPSPFNSVRFYYWAEEFARGSRLVSSNPMRWDTVKLNLPGAAEYTPTLPHVYKWNNLAQHIAGDVVTYIDDLRVSGYSMENSWQVGRQLASRFQYLGIQDAARKRRPPSQRPGAWAGSLLRVTCESITKSVTVEKWQKGQAIIQSISKVLGSKMGILFDHKTLERQRGFLVHLAMTFTSITPFLKGIHLTLDSWRPKRGPEGWKMTDKEWDACILNGAEDYVLHEQDNDVEVIFSAGQFNTPNSAPPTVSPVPRMFSDVDALQQIFAQESPPEIMVRVATIVLVVFAFGDASGLGFGSSFERSDGIGYRIGIWGYEESEESSNFREFRNVVESIEEEAARGRLNGSELFFFTDNSTVESALFHGTSSSPKLLELVIRMRLIETKYTLSLKVSHVSGKRMIAQGSDGISRGLLSEGVMAGASMLSFVPLHISALDRSPALVPWLLSWAGPNANCLTSDGWFERGHDVIGGSFHKDGFWRPKLQHGIFVWAPPPAAADVALEELRKARIKRQKSQHIFVCPRLYTPHWLRQLYKVADIVFPVPPGLPYWPDEMFEPCLIGIVFPFLRSRPWQLQGTPKMHSMVRELRRVWFKPDVDAGTILRQFCEFCRRLDSVPASILPKLLYFR